MSYLTPDWLLGDINQMLRTSKEGAKKGYGDALSKGEFEKEYYKSGPSYTGNRYYSYDFGDTDFSDNYWAGNNSYKFGDKHAAYDAYLGSLGMSESSGFGTQTANIFDPQSLAEGVARAEGDDPAGVDASSKTAFTPEMFKKLRTEYYQPQIEQERGSLIDKLIGKQKLAKSRGGGFAGYGGREKASEAVEGQYRTGVEDIYSGIETQKASGLQDIYDVLSQYEVS